MKIRLSVALLLIGIELMSIATLSLIPRNWWYYVACIGFNWTIVLLLYTFPPSILVDIIQRLNLYALIIQGIGLFIYWASWSVIIYNVSIHLISIAQIYFILKIGGENGLASNGFWRVIFYNLPAFSAEAMQEKETECTT